MKVFNDPHLRRDVIKLCFLAFSVAAVTGVFLVTPALSTPTLLSIGATMVFSPLVSALERRGLSRSLSIVVFFAAIGAILTGLTVYVAQGAQAEWLSFKARAPELFRSGVERLRAFEAQLKSHYPVLEPLQPTEAVLEWGNATGKWFVDNGAQLAGSLLSLSFIAPFLTFVMLNDGRQIRRAFFALVPNRFFESFFLVSNDILTAISDYLRAKLVEAFLVGLLTFIGLWIVGAPYALVLAVVAGVTNILPYVGPLIGAAPGLLVAAFDMTGSGLLVPVALVYVVANVIDTVVIFPLIVAKLVNLHPLILIAAVAVGQQYYGLVGMLLSIPITAALKVILQEMYAAIYEQRSARTSAGAAALRAEDGVPPPSRGGGSPPPGGSSPPSRLAS